MEHGNGKKMGIELNNYHLHGEVLANFPNFGLISKLGPKDQCLASFLGLARQAGYSNLYLAKIRLILQNFKMSFRCLQIDQKHQENCFKDFCPSF